MTTNVSQNFYDKLRKHFETGVSLVHMSFTDDQKRRIEVCMDAYKRFATDPFMDIDQYIRNKWGRTFSELKLDKKVIEFIAAFYEDGQRNIVKAQIRHASRVLMKNGSDTGNMKALYDGASLAFKLERLDQPDVPEDMDANMAKMPIMVTTNVSKKFKNKTDSDSEQMKRLRKKWGVKQDEWQEMVEKKTGEYVPVYYEKEEEDEIEENHEEFPKDEDNIE